MQLGCSYGLQAIAQIRATWVINSVLILYKPATLLCGRQGGLGLSRSCIRGSSRLLAWSRGATRRRLSSSQQAKAEFFQNSLGQLRHISQERGPLEWQDGPLGFLRRYILTNVDTEDQCPLVFHSAHSQLDELEMPCAFPRLCRSVHRRSIHAFHNVYLSF